MPGKPRPVITGRIPDAYKDLTVWKGAWIEVDIGQADGKGYQFRVTCPVRGSEITKKADVRMAKRAS